MSKGNRLYCTVWKDGHMLPDGFVTSTKTGTITEIEDRLTLALCALESVGYEVQFSEHPSMANGEYPKQGYLGV